jgi:dihydrofolate synthase/folylpolyglutamate synthase
VLLEVGLGGRLDAVNIIDPDVALVTSIGIDHVQWLGDDRESIGREKAGIFRPGRPAICCDPHPPSSLGEAAGALGAHWLCLGEHFTCRIEGDVWHWHGMSHHYEELPHPALAGGHQFRNAAGVLMALETLGQQLPVTEQAIRQGLRTVALPARCQSIPGSVVKILDVAHNPDAARCLVQQLNAHPYPGSTHLVLGMLEDKDVGGFARILQPAVDHWHLAGLQGQRGLSAVALSTRIRAAGITAAMQCHDSVAKACRQVMAHAATGDRIVICGSFHTVAEAIESGV